MAGALLTSGGDELTSLHSSAIAKPHIIWIKMLKHVITDNTNVIAILTTNTNYYRLRKDGPICINLPTLRFQSKLMASIFCHINTAISSFYPQAPRRSMSPP